MPGFGTSVPHTARVYDYWLGGGCRLRSSGPQVMGVGW